MTRIRASCPDCGEVDLLPADIVLRIVREADGEVGDGSCYRFACPDCAELIKKPADERIAQLLTTGGVPVEEICADYQPPPLPPHPEHPAPGTRLTYDDLLDFHLALDTEGWFEELAAAST